MTVNTVVIPRYADFEILQFPALVLRIQKTLPERRVSVVAIGSPLSTVHEAFPTEAKPMWLNMGRSALIALATDVLSPPDGLL